MTHSTAPQSRVAAYIHDLVAPGWALALAPFIYAAIMAIIGDLRFDHLISPVIIAGFWLASRPTRNMVAIAAPAGLIVVAYDALRYLRPLLVTPERVAGCDLRAIELSLFGVGPDMTMPDYFTTHHVAIFDAFFAVPYAGFAYMALIYAIIFYFRDLRRMRVYVWSFVGIYLVAFAIWMAYPAAPPWYIQSHGCAIDFSTPPNAAALLRVDQLMGFGYFESFYSRSSTVFGAMPSIHNASAMIILLSAWPIAGVKERSALLFYALWMIAGSVYLDHHWLIDGFAGWLSAAASIALSAWALRDGTPSSGDAPQPA